MKNTLHILGLLALTALGTASAGASTGDQTITFNMDKIQVLDVVDPSTPLTMTWSNADWVAGDSLNDKYDPFWGGSAASPSFLPGGSISYSTNTNSVIVVTATNSPSYISHMHVMVNNMDIGVYYNGDTGQYPVGPGANSLSLNYGALANNAPLAGNAASTDTKTFTFTLQDQ